MKALSLGFDSCLLACYVHGLLGGEGGGEGGREEEREGGRGSKCFDVSSC